MKKQILLLAGSALILASCGSNNETQTPTQAQIDSTVNAEVAKRDAENAAKNDSLLQAIEKEKADAMQTKTTTKTKTKTTVTKDPAPPPPPPPPPPPTVGQGKPKMGGQTQTTEGNKESNTVGQGKPKMGGGK